MYSAGVEAVIDTLQRHPILPQRDKGDAQSGDAAAGAERAAQAQGCDGVGGDAWLGEAFCTSKLPETSFPSAILHGTGVCAEAALLQGCMV